MTEPVQAGDALRMGKWKARGVGWAERRVCTRCKRSLELTGFTKDSRVCNDCEALVKLRTEQLKTRAGQLKCGIPPMYHGACGNDFTSGVRDAVALWKKRKGGLFVFGPCGTGKTRLLYAIKRMMLPTNRDTKLITVADMVRQLQAAAGSGGKAEGVLIKRFTNYSVLLMDDLGASKMTEYAISAFGDVLDKVSAWEPWYAVTSNLSLEKIGADYSPRFESRLSGGVILEMAGKDRRPRRKE